VDAAEASSLSKSWQFMVVNHSVYLTAERALHQPLFGSRAQQHQLSKKILEI
jgi:hypothetical protein